MIDKLGIVTNCLARRLADGDAFENLIHGFAQNGFLQIEIRDGDYLRDSAFGETLTALESAMGSYSDAEWQQLCVAVHNQSCQDLPWLLTRDLKTLNRFECLLLLNPAIVLSYAIAHPWTSRPSSQMDDEARIIRAQKLACLFAPGNARLRLVDLTVEAPVDEDAAISNLQRYRSLTPECPVTLAVENSILPPHIILDLAIRGGAYIAYDEANIFSPDGTAANGAEMFWEHLGNDHLISVHLKQKTDRGVCECIGEGFVDFQGLIKHLSARSYGGDWLLEYKATNRPLEDAIYSREYLLALQTRGRA